MSKETQINDEVLESAKVPKKKMELWKKILIGVGGFVIAIILLASWATADLNKVVDKELNLIRSGDYKGAYALTSSAFQKETSYDGFTAFLNQYPILKNNVKFSSDSSERKDGIGSVKGTLKAKDGATLPLEIQFVQEGNWWLIHEIKLPSSNSTDSAKVETDQSSNSALAVNCDSKELGFSLQCPSNWTKQQKDYQFIVASPKDTNGKNTIVLIQKIGTRVYDKTAKYKGINDLLKSLVSIFRSQYKNVKANSPTEISYTKADGTVLKGKQYEISYEYNKEKFKDWQAIVPENEDGSIIFTWEYISSADQYDANLPTIQGMFNSWKVQ